jgi:hypothetical protein
MHICAGPEDPHAEHSEECQTISHHSIVACLCSILGPDVHVLPEEKGRDNPDSDGNISAIPEAIFFHSHFSISVYLIYY